jgi:hypothetical protein
VTQLIGIGLPKPPAPTPHRFISEDDAMFGHQLFDIAVVQAEVEGEPDTGADHLYRKPMALIQVGWWIHAATMTYGVGAGQGSKRRRGVPKTWTDPHGLSREALAF